MKFCILFVFVAGVLGAQVAQLHGRVFNTQKPAEGIPGVHVLLQLTGHPDQQTLTGRDGLYEFLLLPRGHAQVTFVKKPWQPEPHTVPVEIAGSKELDVDLFQQPRSPVAIEAIAEYKAAFINTALTKGTDEATLAFASEWNSCETAEIPVSYRVLCAKVLSEKVGNSAMRPRSLVTWSNVNPRKVFALESTLGYADLRNSDEGGLRTFEQQGIPADIVFEHVKFEVGKANVNEEEKVRMEVKARTVLGLHEQSGGATDLNRWPRIEEDMPAKTSTKDAVVVDAK